MTKGPEFVFVHLTKETNRKRKVNMHKHGCSDEEEEEEEEEKEEKKKKIIYLFLRNTYI